MMNTVDVQLSEDEEEEEEARMKRKIGKTRLHMPRGFR